MNTGLIEGSIEQMCSALENRTVTCEALVTEYLERIESFDKKGPKLNAILQVNPMALEEARERDQLIKSGKQRGVLLGIPVIIKDQLETAGIITTYGSSAFRSYLPARDATVIARLRDAGAVILAKTAMSDFATSWFGISSLSGETKNPYDLGRDPGGSSSGTGAGVAAGFGAVGIGEDTGGSIRVPSSFNNLVGIRVTTGLISRWGMSPLVVLQDTAGPMARSVADAARVLDCLVGYDSRDPYTASTVCGRVTSYRDNLVADGLRNVRVGVLRAGFESSSNPEAAPVNEVIERALLQFEELGAIVIDPITIEQLEEFAEETTLYYVRSKYDINRYLASLPDSPFRSLEEVYDSGQFDPRISLFAEVAQGPSDPELDPTYFRRVAARESFQRSVLNSMAADGLDAIVYPTVRVLPPRRKDVEEMSSNASSAVNFPTNTVIASHSNLPAISMPVGFTSDGLPVGLELTTRPFDESQLIRIAYAFECAFRPRRAPDLLTSGTD